jgi:SAM-dependent methyltransferase
MHPSAMSYGGYFFRTYCLFPSTDLATDMTIVEIGSQNVNGSLRQVAPKGAKYIGLDFAEGAGVDVVISDPYALPLPDESADAVVSSSCFEHSEFFWLVFLEVMRILKPDGVFYLNVPSNGVFHPYPVDCWRFYPDSGHALVAWGKRNGLKNIMLLESFIGARSAPAIGAPPSLGVWNDFVAIFLKNKQYSKKYPNKIIHQIDDFINGYSNDANGIIRHSQKMSDLILLMNLISKTNALSEEIRRNLVVG